MSHLHIEDLVVRYGPATALDGITLSIAPGEMFVLLGGSGSGKTTLLRALGGFIQPTAGRITLGGQDITHLPPHKRPVNTTFQSYALFPHMTVADNIAFGLRRQGTPKPTIATRVAELLALVRLTDFANRRPEALSGGQRQRVALARALAPRPRLLLLDEPLSALDRSLRESTRHELLRIQRETATTFILVTHDQDEALSMATRIGLLHNGRLEQVATPVDIYERPATRYAATFMGAANIFDVTPEGIVPALGPIRSAMPLEGARYIALRPERLLLSTVEPTGEPNQAQGTIEQVTYRGDTADILIRLPTGLALNVSRPLGEGSGAGLPRPGAVTAVSWTPETCLPLAA